nr:hypothetical protein [Treponemataceae bacterium]
MKTKTLLDIKVIALIVFLLCALFTTFSCSNLFSDVTTSSVSSGETKTPAGEVNRTITVTGTIRNPYEQPRNQSRSALPSYDYPDTDKQYVVTATAPGVSGTVSGTADTTNNTFSIPLELGKIWTIKVELQKKETGDSDYVKVMEGSYTFPAALTEVNTEISIEINPCITAGKTGAIALYFAPAEGLYDTVSVEIGNVAQRTAWNTASPSVNAGGISASSIKSGVYSVVINFYKDDILVYSTLQEINVFDDMTTNRWIDGGTQNTPISGGNFVLTESLINYFKYTNYFVASATNTPAGNNGNSGSPYAPLATISEA